MKKKNAKSQKKNVKAQPEKEVVRKRRPILVLVICLVLLVAAVAAFYLLGNGKPVEDTPVIPGPTKEITSDYAHPIPQDLEYTGTLTLKNEDGYRDMLAQAAGYNGIGQPLPYYDDNGEEAGRYLADDTGWVYGWMDFEGKTHELPKDEQFESFDLVMNGEYLMMDGEVTVHIIIYMLNDTPVACYRHYILSDADDMDALLTALVRSGVTAEKVSATVALEALDAEAVDAEMPTGVYENNQVAYAGLMAQRFGAKG